MSTLNVNQENTHTASIKKNLVNSISILFGVIIFIVYLTVDLSLDGWVDEQFEKNLVSQSGYLIAALRDGDTGSLTHLNKKENELFYQVWQQNRSRLRSPSLKQYPKQNLLKINIPINTEQILNVTLPSGKKGKAYLTHLMLNTKGKQPVATYITIYQSIQSYENMLLLVDILLITSFFLSLFLMRFISLRIVSKGLKPLQHLNDKLKDLKQSSLDINQKAAYIDEPDVKFQEIEPIRKEINAYIQSNIQLLTQEKRLTNDIAHELKTPIAEMMSLTEMSIRFPDDIRISESYQQDMLNISHRMKNIVDNLLLLQRTESNTLQLSRETLNFEELITQIIDSLRFKYHDAQQRIQVYLKESILKADKFSWETILTNLIDNALFYSPASSVIIINQISKEDAWHFSITNMLESPLKKQELTRLIEPLYQVDTSRTLNNRHGLGLSIVNNLCKKNNYKLNIYSPKPNEICFQIQTALNVSIPK